MVANMVLHHVANPADALKEVHRGLRPGGLFILADLAAHSEESYREKLGAMWLGFERQEIESWLEEAHLELTGFEALPDRDDRPTVIIVKARARQGAALLLEQNVKAEL
jgi:ArsR family transcriptional regulator